MLYSILLLNSIVESLLIGYICYILYSVTVVELYILSIMFCNTPTRKCNCCGTVNTINVYKILIPAIQSHA